LRIENGRYSISGPLYEVSKPVRIEKNDLVDDFPRVLNSQFATHNFQFRTVSGGRRSPFTVDTSKFAVILKKDKSHKVMGA